MRSLWAIGFGAFFFAISSPLLAQPGAPSPASVEDKAVVKAAEFAIAAQLKTMKQGEKLALVKILSAQKQVVSGMNYKLTLQVKHGDKLRPVNTEVWEQAWKKEPYKMTSWAFTDEKPKAETKSEAGKKPDATPEEKKNLEKQDQEKKSGGEKSKSQSTSKQTGKSKEPKR